MSRWPPLDPCTALSAELRANAAEKDEALSSVAQPEGQESGQQVAVAVSWPLVAEAAGAVDAAAQVMQAPLL